MRGGGAWVNSLFRNESPHLSSELIREAVSASRAYFGDPPAMGDTDSVGIISFINAGMVRHKRDPGRCYKKAGWRRLANSKGGLLTFGLSQSDIGEAVEALPAWSRQMSLFG